MTEAVKVFLKDSPEYKRLQRVAAMFTRASPNRRMYFVGKTCYDLRQGWQWTTILCEGSFGAYQVLTPTEQSRILNAVAEDEIWDVIQEVLNDRYCPDRV